MAQKNITYDETEHRYSDHNINYIISRNQSKAKKQYKTRKKEGKKQRKAKHTQNKNTNILKTIVKNHHSDESDDTA